MRKGAVGNGICPACKEKCVAISEDCGIGSYEYWGAKGTHHDWRIFSDCCGEEMNNGDWEPSEPDYQERSMQHWEDLSEDDWRKDR